MKIGKIELGNPWQYSENSVGVVVPILRKIFKDRNYVTMEEAKEKLDIKDTGSINKVEITNKSDKSVFIRSGTMFEGKGTQSRTPTSSIVIMPQQKELKVPVKCIHQSHSISRGSGFEIRGLMPSKTHSRMMSYRSQGEVWGGVNHFADTGTRMGLSGMSDNLIENVRKIDKFKGNIDDIVKKMPVINNQVGVVVLDFNGVVGIEIFDNPESWKAIQEEVIKRYADTIGKKLEESIYKLNKDKIKPKIEKFIEHLSLGCIEDVVFENNGSKTMLLTGEKVIGEYTTINGTMIHLIGMRKPEERPKISLQRRERREHFRGGWTNDRMGGRGTYTTLSAIKEGEGTWKSLKKSSGISQATLSKRLKGLKNLGLIRKTAEMAYGSGKPVIEYKLTDKGKEVFKSMKNVEEKLN